MEFQKQGAMEIKETAAASMKEQVRSTSRIEKHKQKGRKTVENKEKTEEKKGKKNGELE
jgi:hypothetical protein